MSDERTRLRSLVADYCLEHGVSQLTLRSVGRAVGSNNRMLLYYFGSRESLIQEALLETTTRYARLQGVMAALEEDRPLLDRLLDAWTRLSDPANLPFLRLFFEVFGLAVRSPDLYEPFLLNVGNVWGRHAADAFDREGVPEPEAEQLGRELVALWRGFQFELLSGGDLHAITRSYESACHHLASRAHELASTPTRR